MRTNTIIILTIAGLLVLAGAGFYIDSVARNELAAGVRLVIQGGAVVLLMGAIIGLAAWVWILFERGRVASEQRLEAQARRKLAEREASILVTVADAGQQVFLTVPEGLRTYTKPLHLSPALHLNGPGQVISQPELTRWQMYQLAHATAKRADGTAPPPGLIQIEPALALPDGMGIVDRLATEQRLLLLGPSGSGKSSVLRHVVNAKLAQVGQVVLCDPHGSRPRWGEQIDAVGFGERFDQILDTFTRLEWIHTCRIRQIEAGHPERGFEIITVILEEVQAIVEYFNELDKGLKRGEKVNISHYIKLFLTRTRKTGIDVIAASQASTVDALGLRGFSQNRDAFALAELSGRDGRGHRVKFTDEAGQVIEADPPPLWPDYLPVGVRPERVYLLPPAPTAEQYKIIDALRAEPGVSDYKVCQVVWGEAGKGPVKGSSYVNKINEVRALFGPF